MDQCPSAAATAAVRRLGELEQRQYGWVAHFRPDIAAYQLAALADTLEVSLQASEGLHHLGTFYINVNTDPVLRLDNTGEFHIKVSDYPFNPHSVVFHGNVYIDNGFSALLVPLPLPLDSEISPPLVAGDESSSITKVIGVPVVHKPRAWHRRSILTAKVLPSSVTMAVERYLGQNGYGFSRIINNSVAPPSNGVIIDDTHGNVGSRAAARVITKGHSTRVASVSEGTR